MAPKIGQSKSASAPKPVDDFEIKIDKTHQAANVVKANKRMAQIWEAHGIGAAKKTTRVPAHKIGICPLNRIPNLPYVRTLGGNLKRDGFDPDRCQKGFLVLHTDQEKINALVDYNIKLAEGTDQYPPVIRDAMTYECLATTHITVAFRLYQAGKTVGSTGDVWIVPDDDENLKECTTIGWDYYILNDKINDDDKKFIINWKNSDQNQNQVVSEAEHFRNAQQYSIAELKLNNACKGGAESCMTLKIGPIVSKMMNQSLVKLRPDHLGDCVKLVIHLGLTKYVDELLYMFSMNVNPTELCVSIGWFKDLMDKFPKMFVLLILGLIYVQYSGEIKDRMVRPQARLKQM